MDDLYAKSNPELVRELGIRFKVYRLRFKKTQKEVAFQTGLSVFTISSFENGSATGITLVAFMRLLRAIEELAEIENLLPEIPVSPRLLYLKQSKMVSKTTSKPAENEK